MHWYWIPLLTRLWFQIIALNVESGGSAAVFVNLRSEMLGNLNSSVGVLPKTTLEDITAAKSWNAPWVWLLFQWGASCPALPTLQPQEVEILFSIFLFVNRCLLSTFSGPALL